MKKTLFSAAAAILMVLAFSSCVYYVDRPYVYTTQTGQTQPYNQAQDTGFVILRIYDNRYVFYDNNYVIAVWIFRPDGVVIRRGEPINGLVKIFYADEIPAAEMFYRNNLRDGYCRFYHRNGKPMEFGEYRKGLRYGDWKRFNEKGALEEEFAFNGPKITYKLKKAKAFGKNAAAWEFDYLNREHEYKKEVKQEFNDKDIYPAKIKKVFGENPYERKSDRQVPADANRNKKEKGWKFEGNESGRQTDAVEEKSYDDNGGQRGNAYGRDKEDKEGKSFKWQDNAGNREPEVKSTDPSPEITPASIPDEKQGRDNGRRGRDSNDKAGSDGNAYGRDKNSPQPDDAAAPSEQARTMQDPALQATAVETPAQVTGKPAKDSLQTDKAEDSDEKALKENDKEEKQGFVPIKVNDKEQAATNSDEDKGVWKNNKSSRVKSPKAPGLKRDKDGAYEDVTNTAKDDAGEDEIQGRDHGNKTEEEKTDVEVKNVKDNRDSNETITDSKADDNPAEKDKDNNTGSKSRKGKDR